MHVWITSTQAVSPIRHTLALLLLIAAGWCFPALPCRAGETRGLLEFTNAVLFTPARTNMQDRLFAFAPLIVIEAAVTDLAELPASDQFGALEKTGERVTVNPKKPTVYARREVVTLRGRPYERYSYVWWHPTLERTTPIASEGLRITVTPAGQSIAFEILGDTTNAGSVVVSQGMEAAAMQEFRSPLPGRRFAIEQAVGTPFAATVDRVIEDGPLELGPAVYLRANARGVGTVICRCMPAQTRVIAATGYYDLVEWNDANTELLAEGRGQLVIKPLRWLAQPDIESGLERILRLPQHFPGTPATP